MNKFMMIYCRPSLDVIMKNTVFLARAKAHKPPEYVEQVKASLPQIVETYDRRVNDWIVQGLPVLRWDFTTMDMDKFIAQVKDGYNWPQ